MNQHQIRKQIERRFNELHVHRKYVSKLNALAKLVNELDAELKAEFGEAASVFFEADGIIFAMRGDVDGPPSERQEYIVCSSSIYSKHGVGAW